MKKILFVVNQLSGTVSQYNIPKCVDMFLDTSLFEVSFLNIDHDLQEETYTQTLSKPWDIIVSVGGDGTLLELGQRIMDRDIILGIIPIGSGNGLATHLGYKPRKIEHAFQAINKLYTRAVDVAKIGENYFFSNFGIGLDASVARDFKIKKKRSFLVYAYLTCNRLFQLKPSTIYIKSAEKEMQVTTYIFNIFNSNLYGYNVGLLPWASAFDGKLDVVYLAKSPWYRLLWAGFCILIKKPELSKDILFFETEKIDITTYHRVEYQVDGDPKRGQEVMTVEVLPGKLKMIVPH
jgi:diacylglycerol kinase (ATP)